MTILEAIEKRHTIRNYDGKAINEQLNELEELINHINEESGFHLQLVNGKENAFDIFTIRYGKWTHVTNYIALVGKDEEDLDEKVGYYGEQIVLWAEMNGLKTGWLETQLKEQTNDFTINDDERFVLSIAIGYSDKVGGKHKVKELEELSTHLEHAPEWFVEGMKQVQLAPTAGNQQLFNIAYENDKVSISTKPGFLEKVDVGIAKYHFEIGSKKDSSIWS